jgi:hypothetical protein
MTEPPTRERALEQLDALRLLGKIFESHALNQVECWIFGK